MANIKTCENRLKTIEVAQKETVIWTYWDEQLNTRWKAFRALSFTWARDVGGSRGSPHCWLLGKVFKSLLIVSIKTWTMLLELFLWTKATKHNDKAAKFPAECLAFA